MSEPISAKVAHVRTAKQTRAHKCHWPNCSEQVPPAKWGCKPHWFKLPAYIRSAIWRAYRAGQEERLDPSDDYMRAARAAVASLIRPTLEGFDIVEIARLARPETLEQVREWVDKIAQEHGARRIMVHSPRDNELEAWRNHGQRRAEQERLRTSYYMREEEKRLRALAESQRIYEQEYRPPPRGERIRAIMRQRMAGWSYGPGSLLDHWRALA